MQGWCRHKVLAVPTVLGQLADCAIGRLYRSENGKAGTRTDTPPKPPVTTGGTPVITGGGNFG